MKNKERFDATQRAISKCHAVMDSLLGTAVELEVYDYNNFADRARFLVGEIEQLSHDMFQRTIKDDA